VGGSEVYEEPLYYISTVSKMVNLHPQTLRHYEQLGLIQPARSEGNVRLYSLRDIKRLRRICRLSDELGVNLAGVEIILKLLDRLDQLQQELERMQAERACLENDAFSWRAEITRLRQRLGESEVDG